MQLLLDTHAFIWWIAADTRLSETARAAIAQKEIKVFVSAATIWEISIKHRIGKLQNVDELLRDPITIIEQSGFFGLPIMIAHGRLAGALPGPHRDPFDRMLIAQALQEKLALVSNERVFDAYGVDRLW